VITINGSSGAPSPSPQRWDAALAGGVVGGGAGEPASRAPLPSGGRGAGLSSQDISALEAFVQELAVRGVVPHIEARIRALDQTATAARRGLRNQLKSLLFRKAASPAGEGGGQQAGGGADGAAAGGPASYPASSIEAQLRQLSDLCMMVGDHETALSTLRLLAADFKADRAFRHYAGVQEAMAVAAALAGGAASDAASSFREAYYRYASLAQASPPDAAGARLATRAALLMAGFLGAAGRHADASWIAMKAHFGEDNLRGGLLLERAAHSLLRLRPPQPRKFSFHLVLAGLRYNQGGQRALARRAYAQALSVYAGRGWDTIEEHVHEALGKLCEGGGDAAGALAHFTRALALCPGGSEGMQRLHLQQFGQALKGTTAELVRTSGRAACCLAPRSCAAPCPHSPTAAACLQGYAPQVDLPLPVVDVEHVGLAVAGQAGYASVEARQVPREEWAPLQAALQPSADAAPTWLDGGSRAGLADQPERHNCCVGEDIGVDVGLTNPLRLALAVTRLRLVCQFEPAAGGGAPAAAPAGGAAPPRPEAPPFQIREERITLHGGERAVVHLRVRPLRPGTLRVEGVAWELDGEAHGQRSFAIPRPRPRKPGSSVALLDAERPPAGGLVFAVLPPMPRLEVALEGLPATVLEGQLVRATLRLKNTGAMTLQGLSMAAGGGDMFLESSSPASGGDVDGNGGVETPGGGAPAKKAPSAATVSAATRQGVPVFCLDPATKLGVNQELCLPLWLRCASAELIAHGGQFSTRNGRLTWCALCRRPGACRSTRPGPTRFSCVWYYEPVVKLDALRFRTLRASFTASTLPSLQLAAAVAPAASSPGRYLLQLQALNLQGLETFALQQLSVPTAAWAASHLAGVQPAGEQRGSLALDVELAPESSAGLHFHLAARDGAAGAGDGGLSPAEAYLYAAGASAAPREPQPGGKAPAGQGAPPPPPVDAVVKWRATSVAGGQAVSGFHVVHRAR
jgi:tetratricopeptide (TPR) repeat protein